MDSVFITTRKQRVIRELRDYMLIALGMLMYAIVLILAMLFNSAPQFVVIRERMFAALKGNKKPAKEAK